MEPSQAGVTPALHFKTQKIQVIPSNKTFRFMTHQVK
jgi:hypothetical protein